MRRDVMWFGLGILLAGVMLPATVVAAASLVRIQGPSGNVAQVDAARQLMVAESDPAAFYTAGANNSSATGCQVVVAQPSTKALIVRQVRIAVVGSNSLDGQHWMGVWPNKTCTGTVMLYFQPSELGSHTETFEPGYPVAASAGVSIRSFGTGFSSRVDLTGYTVPAAAVP